MNHLPLLNMRTREVVCHCEAHCGDTIRQIDAQLPNGKPIAIMEDWRGFHVAIGARDALGQYPYTPPVSEEEIEQIIKDAMSPLNEYELVTKKGKGYVYAERFDLLDFPGENVAQFYRADRICYTARDVLTVELIP